MPGVTPEVFVRVHGMKGLHPDVIRRFPRGKLSVSGKIGDSQGALQSTDAVTWGGGVKMNEVSYAGNEGTMRWAVPSALLQEVKASQPRLKFSLYAHDAKAAAGTEGEKVGYIVVDMRDLNRGVREKSYRVHSMGGGAELQITAQINTLLQSIEVGPGGLVAQMEDVAGSAESSASALKIGDGDSGSYLPRYDISVALQDFKGLAPLCQAYVPGDVPALSSSDSPPPPDAGTKFWLSWSLFDKTFQSSTFTASDSGPERSVDTVRVQCSAETLFSSLAEAFPLRIFVCTPGRIVAAAEIGLDGGVITQVPVSISGWNDFFVPMGSMAHTVERASVLASVSVEQTRAGRTPEAPSEPAETSVDEAVFTPAPEPPAPAPVESDWEEARVCHFRLTVDVRSVTGLSRAANYAVNYGYPHLGTAAPVRTHPKWITANSEAVIEGGTATFECIMPRSVFSSTLTRHPLVLKASSRSHLGSEDLGSATVDLGRILHMPPHSFRCPLTGKVFRTKEAYDKHRGILVSLRAQGKVDKSPPEDPVTVWTSDMLLEMVKDLGNGRTGVEGGTVRSVFIIEDMGSVGSNLAQKVKPGFKSHGAAVYEVDEGESVRVSASGKMGIHEASALPMARNPLTDRGSELSRVERQYLEKLQSEWETWRREAEVAWREDLRDREAATRRAIEEEATEALAERAEELRKAQSDVHQLETRLRAAIESVDRQKKALEVKDEELGMRLTQKTAELQLLQRRVRDEAKGKVDSMTTRLEAQERQAVTLHRQLDRAERRAKEAEKDYEQYRQHMRATPEATLREEVARLKAGIAETRAVLERERRLKSETELEKEHFRAQMTRLAQALKREREKSSSLARQELEQMRLEFLAREERYVLDGDREELKTIRQEIGALRRGVQDRDMLMSQAAQSASDGKARTAFVAGNTVQNAALTRLQQQRIDLIATGAYTADDAVIREIDKSIAAQQKSVETTE